RAAGLIRLVGAVLVLAARVTQPAAAGRLFVTTDLRTRDAPVLHATAGVAPVSGGKRVAHVVGGSTVLTGRVTRLRAARGGSSGAVALPRRAPAAVARSARRGAAATRYCRGQDER